jgi:transcriptional regulator with XRE-family HTH domain
MDEQWDWLYRESGRLVAGKRKQLKITQCELAQGLDMSRASIANIEAGKQRMQLHLLFKLAKQLQASPYDLVPSMAAVTSPHDKHADKSSRMSDELLIREIIDKELAIAR